MRWRITPLYSNTYQMVSRSDLILGYRDHTTSPLPLNYLFMLPELPRCTINIPQRQKHRCSSAFIDSLRSSTLRHVRDHKSGTAAVDQYLSPFRFVLMRNRSCHPGNATLTNSIGCAGPSFLFLVTVLYCGCECFHQLCNIVGSLRGGKRIADGIRILGIEVTAHAGDVYESPPIADKRK